jgi:hypothetical protein
MKMLSCVFLLGLPLILSAAEVRPGNTLGEVRAALGTPNGQLRIGDRHLLYYDRGDIELRSGAVTRVALLSDADYAALVVRRGQIREEQEARRARQCAEGEALKARMLADSSFQAAPPAYQIAFWENFTRRYPEVSDTEPLLIARLRLAEQARTQIEQEQRLAELEARVAEAEARAAEAALYRGPAYISYAGRYARHPFNFWPIEYHFNNSQPSDIATPVWHSQPANDRHNRIERQTTECFDYQRHDSTNRDCSFDHHSGRGERRNRL